MPDAAPVPAEPAALGPAPPPGFVARPFRRSWRVGHGRGAVWAWLNRPATFADGQVPPWRVEFVAPDGTPGGFETGTWTAHHGPGTLFAGVLGEVVGPAPGVTAYRDLRYGYGSYAGSLRLARPTRLQFWADDAGPDACAVTVQLDADVARWLAPAWDRAMGAFWSGFGRALDVQVAAQLGGAPAAGWRRGPTAALAGLALAAGLALGARR